MKRKDCNNSKPNANMDIANEINPNMKNIKGQCNVGNQKCKSADKFNCDDSFEK